jgi:transposase
VLGDVLEGVGYRVLEALRPPERGCGKTDELDALLAARSTLVIPLRCCVTAALASRTVRCRSSPAHAITSTWSVLRCINALTALVCGHDLGIEARRALDAEQISTIAGWRRREESLGIATARVEATRLARRISAVDSELAERRAATTELVMSPPR